MASGRRLSSYGRSTKPNPHHARWQDTAHSHLRIYTVAAKSHVCLVLFNPVCVFHCYDVATDVFPV